MKNIFRQTAALLLALLLLLPGLSSAEGAVTEKDGWPWRTRRTDTGSTRRRTCR